MNRKLILVFCFIANLLSARSVGPGSGGSRGSSFGGGMRSMGGSYGGPMRGTSSFAGPVRGPARSSGFGPKSFGGSFVSSGWPGTRSIPATSWVGSSAVSSGWTPGDEGIESWTPGTVRQTPTPASQEDGLLAELEGSGSGPTQPAPDAISKEELNKIIEKTVRQTVARVKKDEQTPQIPENSDSNDPVIIRKNLNKALTQLMQIPELREPFLKRIQSPEYSKVFAAYTVEPYTAKIMTQIIRRKVKEATEAKAVQDFLEIMADK